MQVNSERDRFPCFCQRSDVSFDRFKARGKFHRFGQRRGGSASKREGNGARVCGIGQREPVPVTNLTGNFESKQTRRKCPRGSALGRDRDRAGSSWNSIYYRGVMQRAPLSFPPFLVIQVLVCLRVIGKLKPGCTIIMRVSPPDRITWGLSWPPRANASPRMDEGGRRVARKLRSPNTERFCDLL